jgi:hypothetical protein
MKRSARVVHVSPGRLRLRMAWLRGAADEAGPLSERLSKIQGVQQIEIRPYTGSVLCVHDPLVIESDPLLEEIRRAAELEEMFRPGEGVPPAGSDALARVTAEGSTVGKAVRNFFRELNRDLVRNSEGRLDLATATALTFAAAGAVEVVATRKLMMPAWFDFIWWTYRVLASSLTVRVSPEEADPRLRQGELPFDPHTSH